MNEIVLEGSAYTGKTPLAHTLGELQLSALNRSPAISPYIELDGNSEDAISAAAESILRNHSDDLVVLLVARDDSVLADRRSRNGAEDEHDLNAEAYNAIYSGLGERLIQRNAPNVVVLPIDGLGLDQTTRRVVEPWTQRNIGNIDFDNPTVEGHSKRIYSLGSIAVTELIPSLFSITHNRYDTNVAGTNELRTDFWELFGQHLNHRMSEMAANNGSDPELQGLLDGNIVSEDYPFLSNFLGRISVGDKDLVIAKFAGNLPPIEIIWKRYLVGTMKHKLLEVDQYPMRNGQYMQYEGEFPTDFIRFDWRNPVPDEQIEGKSRERPIEDEAIPDAFAEFYINTSNARQTGMAVSHAINKFLEAAGYRFVDTCYFMNQAGNLIYSEITPDGMRVKSQTESGSFDKDLWRQGKDAATLRRVWGKLLSGLQAAQ